MGVYFLKRLEQETSRSIFDSFDLFIGTSAGAINALMLGINGSSITDIEEFWTKANLRKIMNQSFIDKTSILQTRPKYSNCLLYTSPSPRDLAQSRMPSSA